MRLEDYGEALAHEVAFWMQGLTNPDYPANRLGKLSLELSDKLRGLAIITLLVKGEPDFFYHNLIRSGTARETYLSRTRDAGLFDDHHRASGRYEPLLDAIAAGDLALVRRIATLSPGEFRENHEYEDDYCYAQILQRLSQEPPEVQDILALFQRLEVFLNGQDSVRLALCRALTNVDQAAFDEAFLALIETYTADIEADKKRGRLEEPEVIAQRQVFIEGLALLRLAEVRGLATESEYRYCPSLARVPMQIPFPGE